MRPGPILLARVHRYISHLLSLRDSSSPTEIEIESSREEASVHNPEKAKVRPQSEGVVRVGLSRQLPVMMIRV